MSFLQDITAYVKSGETQTENLGLEIEHFVVDENGEQIGFAEVSALIRSVAEEIGAEILYTDGYPAGYVNERYSVTLEPSCQFEISISPYAQLCEIEEVYRDFLAVWTPIFRRRGYRFVTKGNLPLVESGRLDPFDIPLSPKKRYQYMDAYFRDSGKYGHYMMRAAASTQVSVDYTSEADLVQKLSVLQKISPILMIMMENKSDPETSLPGISEKPHLLRIQEWDDLDPDRTGFFPGSLEPGFGYQKIAEAVYRTPLILLTDQGVTTPVGRKNAQTLVDEGIFSEEEPDAGRRTKQVEHVLSMGFFHFRIKKYIEIRVADSVPIDKALGYAALLKGIVYAKRNLDILENELSDIDDVAKIQDAVLRIEAHGHDAVIYQDRTAAAWAEYLVDLARDVLPEQEREYLNYV